MFKDSLGQLPQRLPLEVNSLVQMDLSSNVFCALDFDMGREGQWSRALPHSSWVSEYSRGQGNAQARLTAVQPKINVNHV